MTRAVVFSPRAEQQLRSIVGYVADQSGAARASAYLDRIMASCLSLAEFPERGVRRDDVFPGLRVMGMRRQATIAFTIGPDRVVIQGIYGPGRDVGPLLPPAR